jgi:hypothetical protein
MYVSRTNSHGCGGEHERADLTSSMQITSAAHFANDLGLDSLDTVEVVMAIEEVGAPNRFPSVPAAFCQGTTNIC